MPTTPQLPPVVRRFIQEAGSLTQSLGIGRVIGQMYAYLYFSPEPRSLADMQEALAISKGGASMVVRQLEQWNAVRKIWVKGDRKDYYEANDWIGEILKNILKHTIGKSHGTTNELLTTLQADDNGLDGIADERQREFVRQRVEHLHQFNAKAARAWSSPLVKLLLR